LKVRRPGLRRIAKPAFVVCLGLILYLIAANSGAGWLYVVAAAIGAVVIVSASLPWWNVRGIEATRRAPVQVTAGEPFECTLELRNTRRLARYLLEVEDRFAEGVGRAVAVRVGSREPEAVRYAIEHARRGIYSSGEVLVETGAPFGLFYGRRRVRVDSEVVVYPRTFDVAGLPPSAIVDTERGDRSEASTLRRGHAGELWGVREYRPGDPARLVAWKRSARGLPVGKLAVVELAQETHPPFVVALNLDPRAPREAREMVVSLGASLLLYALDEGREIRADAGLENQPFPEEVTRDSVLTWCAGLRYSSPPDEEGTIVEIRPSIRQSTRNLDTTGKPHPTPQPGASEARAVVLVSCHAFAGRGPWMSPEEELEFVEKVEANGRLAARVGTEVEEPWRIW
jgi:uncharacterized protein (DUF58 family)